MKVCLSVLASFVVSLVVHAACAAEPVTTCGQRVSEGVLTGDLDCTGMGLYAVQVERSLALAGFTITGDGGASGAVVRCVRPDGSDTSGNCVVTGPGTVRTAGVFSHGVLGRKVTVRDLTVDGTGSGVVVEKSANLQGCLIDSVGGTGVLAAKARVTDTMVIDSGAFGVAAGRRALLRGSTVTGSVLDGVSSGGRVVLRNSSVTENAMDAGICAAALDVRDCGRPEAAPWICSDVSSDGPITLRGGSACGSSLVQSGSCGSFVDYRPGPSHGVCQND